MSEIVVAMSGGVDSSVTAMLMKNEGYRVVGVTMMLHEHYESSVRDAKLVAETLKIEHHVLDVRAEFKKHIIDVFVECYANGLTPNPCCFCNKYIKSGILFEFARKNGIELLATGHYAKLTQLSEGGVSLSESFDKSRDQSYFLSLVPSNSLANMRFPLEGMKKPDVRKLARETLIPVSDKKDSQDICFIPNNDYKKFLQENGAIGEETRKRLFTQGRILKEGEEIGIHDGIAMYTVGQRRGLGISNIEPLYVLDINPESLEINVGTKDKLMINNLKVQDVNWLIKKRDKFECQIKLRSGSQKLFAEVDSSDRNNVFITIKDDMPKLCKTPISKGQVCVMYENETVIGGGLIV
jgi:tRNA-specific 2-thiouridylase